MLLRCFYHERLAVPTPLLMAETCTPMSPWYTWIQAIPYDGFNAQLRPAACRYARIWYSIMQLHPYPRCDEVDLFVLGRGISMLRRLGFLSEAP